MADQHPGADKATGERVTPEEVRANLAEHRANLAPYVNADPSLPPFIRTMTDAVEDVLVRWLANPASVTADELLAAERYIELTGQWRVETRGHDAMAAERIERLDLFRRMRADASNRQPERTHMHVAMPELPPEIERELMATGMTEKQLLLMRIAHMARATTDQAYATEIAALPPIEDWPIETLERFGDRLAHATTDTERFDALVVVVNDYADDDCCWNPPQTACHVVSSDTTCHRHGVDGVAQHTAMQAKPLIDLDHLVGANIRQLREERGWSIQKFADVLDVNRRYIPRWESGEVHPRDYLIAIAAAFDVPVARLYDEHPA